MDLEKGFSPGSTVARAAARAAASAAELPLPRSARFALLLRRPPPVRRFGGLPWRLDLVLGRFGLPGGAGLAGSMLCFSFSRVWECRVYAQ